MNYKEAFSKVKAYMESKKEILGLVTCDELCIWSNEFCEYILEEYEFGWKFYKRNIEMITIPMWSIPVNDSFEVLMGLLDNEN